TRHDFDSSLPKPQGDLAGHRLLRLVDEGVQGLTQGGEPEAVVDDLGVVESEALLVVEGVAIEGESLQFAVGEHNLSAARGLVAAARLHADEAVLYQVDTADAVLGA